VNARYGSRKFLVALFALVSADAALFLGLIDAGVWGSTVGGVIGLYAAANVAQKATAKT
jgi:hypothetical protein